jgi:heme/copper-type cytochrome/quinol oxidase subunit 2
VRVKYEFEVLYISAGLILYLRRRKRQVRDEPQMKKIAAAAAILVAIVVATATILFFLNQTDALNQTSEVRITAFSVDPEGWKDTPDSNAACLFSITLQNTGTNDVQGMRLKVTMFGFGEIWRGSKAGTGLGVNSDLRNFTLCAGEVREFQGEMRDGATMAGLYRSPVGATYVAQVMLGNDVLDEAEWTDSFATVLVVAVTVTLVTVITVAILNYFKKRKR